VLISLLKTPNTVKPVFKDHPKEKQKWSLKAGGLFTYNFVFLNQLARKKSGLYQQVVFVYRWSLAQVGLDSNLATDTVLQEDKI
jgi:hypothetical protein